MELWFGRVRADGFIDFAVAVRKAVALVSHWHVRHQDHLIVRFLFFSPSQCEDLPCPLVLKLLPFPPLKTFWAKRSIGDSIFRAPLVLQKRP
jgi:hypothetical protein